MKANKFIEKRNNLSNTISQYWYFITKENLVPRSYKREHDLKVLFEEIKNIAEQRVITKMKLIAINMGFKSFKDLPVDCNQWDVFRLCELNELKVRLGKVPTLNPTLKAKKGKKALSKTEVLTSAWIKERIKELDLQILKLQTKLTKFNDETEFDDTAAPMKLVA